MEMGPDTLIPDCDLPTKWPKDFIMIWCIKRPSWRWLNLWITNAEEAATGAQISSKNPSSRMAGDESKAAAQLLDEPLLLHMYTWTLTRKSPLRTWTILYLLHVASDKRLQLASLKLATCLNWKQQNVIKHSIISQIFNHDNLKMKNYVSQQYYAKQLQISRNEDHKSLARKGRARRCITYDSGCFFESAYHCIDRSLTPWHEKSNRCSLRKKQHILDL